MKSFGKLSTTLLLVIIVLAIVIILSTCLSCRKVIPYNSNPHYTSLDKEGFTPVHYAKYPGGGAVDIKDRNLIQSDAGANTAQRVKNFTGLFGPQDLNPKLDTYSDAQGSLSEDCANTSNGMSNSKGYLCLDSNQITMLKTRGGNQTPC